MMMPVPPMTTMTTMHENVHQWTRQEQQIWQGPDHVSQMLCKEEVGRHTTNHHHADGVA